MAGAGPASEATDFSPWPQRRDTDGTDLLKQSFQHTQHLALDSIGMSRHPAEKHIRRSSTAVGSRPGPTGAGLSHRQGLTASAQLRKHHAGQRLIINPETELAGALAQIVFDRHHQTLRLGLGRSLRCVAQFHLAAACIRCRWVRLIEQIADLRSQRRSPMPQNRSMRLT